VPSDWPRLDLVRRRHSSTPRAGHAVQPDGILVSSTTRYRPPRTDRWAASPVATREKTASGGKEIHSLCAGSSCPGKALSASPAPSGGSADPERHTTVPPSRERPSTCAVHCFCERQNCGSGCLGEVRPKCDQPPKVPRNVRIAGPPLHTGCTRRSIRSVLVVLGKCRLFWALPSRKALSFLGLAVNLYCFCSRSVMGVQTPSLGVRRGSIPPASTIFRSSSALSLKRACQFLPFHHPQRALRQAPGIRPPKGFGPQAGGLPAGGRDALPCACRGAFSAPRPHRAGGRPQRLGRLRRAGDLFQVPSPNGSDAFGVLQRLGRAWAGRRCRLLWAPVAACGGTLDASSWREADG
jgi:hypothetical protein